MNVNEPAYAFKIYNVFEGDFYEFSFVDILKKPFVFTDLFKGLIKIYFEFIYVDGFGEEAERFNFKQFL